MYVQSSSSSEAGEFATREATNTSCVADTECQTDFTGFGTCSEHIALQLCEMHQRGHVRDRLAKDCQYGSPAPPEIRRLVMEREPKQRVEPLRYQRDPVARAREEALLSGTPSTKLRKPRTAKHKPSQPRDKAERQREIQQRRSEAARLRGPMAAYEGMLDSTFKIAEETFMSFDVLFNRMMDRVKEVVNDGKNKITIEHLFKLDDGMASKLLFTTAIVGTAVMLISRYDNMWAFAKFLLAGIATVSVGWAFGDEIREFLVKHLLVMTTGRDPEAEWQRRKADVKSVAASVAEWVKSLGARPTAEEGDPLADEVLPEGLLDIGGGNISYALAELCSGAVSLICGTIFTGGSKTLADKIVKLHKSSSDLKNIFTEIMKWIADKVDRLFGTSFSDLYKRNAAVEAWADDVQNKYKQFTAGQVPMNATTGRVINGLMLRGLELARRYEQMDASSWALHRFVTGIVHKMEAAIGAAGVAMSERQVPLVVVLRGESGIGKSYIQHALIDQIALRVLETKEEREDYDRNHASEKHMWLSEEEHANGYFGQFATIFDDFGQFLTQKGQADDYIRIIRMANAAPCRLNAAELERKGRVVFTSPLIVCSSNLYQYWAPSLAKNEALVRRFDVTVNMVPRREFCTDSTMNKPNVEKRLDKTKLRKVFEKDACEYHLLKCIDAAQQKWITEKVCSFRELIDVCVERFNDHKNRHNGLMEALAEERAAVMAEIEAKECGADSEVDVYLPNVPSMLDVEEQCARDRQLLMRELELADESKASDGVADATPEGWLSWLRFVPQPPETVAQRIWSLKLKARDAMIKLQKLYLDASWSKKVVYVLAFFAIVIACAALICWALGGFSEKKNHQVVDDPDLFLDLTTKKLSLLFGMEDMTFSRLAGYIGIKRTKKHLNTVRKALEEDGHVTMSDYTLRCPIDKFDACQARHLTAKYESEFFANDASNLRMYHNMLMRSILDKNVYHMYRVYDDPEEVDSAGKITMISSRIGIMNYHYMTQLRKALETGDSDLTHLKLVNHRHRDRVIMVPMSWFLDDDNVVCDPENDLALVRFDKYMPIHKDIVKHFVTEASISQNRDSKVALFACRSPRCLEVFGLGQRQFSDPIRVCGNTHTNIVRYPALTQTGDCGSLLAYTGDYSKSMERICGIHMAGLEISGMKHGYATIVTQEMLKGLLAKFGTVPRIVSDVVVEGEFFVDEDLCHEIVANLERPVYQPVRSAICKSTLYGELGPVTKRPALLRSTVVDGQKIDPLANAHRKQHSYNITVDPDILGHTVDAMVDWFKRTCDNTGDRVLTFREAVVGAPDLPCLGSIPRQTSAGFSYRNDPRVREGKKDFFGYGDEYEFTSPLCKELEAKVEALHAQCAEGIVPEERVYTDILKDENLIHRKVDIGKTRMISACDLPMTILYRMYYGALCNDIVKNRINNGVAVGINPYSREWDYLARKLSQRGGRIVAGDFSDFDKSQSCQLIHATLEVMNRLAKHLTGRRKVVAEVLAVTLAQPYHASKNVVYQLDHGMPSGNPMTTIMNSIFGHIALRLCWVSCTRTIFRTPTLSLKSYEDEVSAIVYGDDNISEISEKFIEKYNLNTMALEMPQFGLGFTSADKEDKNPPPYTALTKADFLKRGFRLDKFIGAYVAPLDMATILNMLHWTKRGECRDSITLDNCQNALREWSLHGQDVYDERSEQLQEALRRRMGFELNVRPWRRVIADVGDHVPSWVREHI